MARRAGASSRLISADRGHVHRISWEQHLADLAKQRIDQYAFQVKPLGGTAPHTYSATGLPANLTIDSSTGLISGTIGNAGRFNVVIKIHDSRGNEQTFYNTFAVDTGFCLLCGLF